jgi:hypothetical protein
VICRTQQENETKNTRNLRSILYITLWLIYNRTHTKAQHDKIKRKALLAPNAIGQDTSLGFSGNLNHTIDRQAHEDQHTKGRTGMGFGNNTVDLGAVVGGMEANGVESYLRSEYACYIDHLSVVDSKNTDCEPHHRSNLRTSTNRLGPAPTHSRTRTQKEPNTAPAFRKCTRSSIPLDFCIGPF